MAILISDIEKVRNEKKTKIKKIRFIVFRQSSTRNISLKRSLLEKVQ